MEPEDSFPRRCPVQNAGREFVNSAAVKYAVALAVYLEPLRLRPGTAVGGELPDQGTRFCLSWARENN